jgi:hypothetical protein
LRQPQNLSERVESEQNKELSRVFIFICALPFSSSGRSIRVDGL